MKYTISFRDLSFYDPEYAKHYVIGLYIKFEPSYYKSLGKARGNLYNFKSCNSRNLNNYSELKIESNNDILY